MEIAANITPQRIETVHLKVTELVERCLSSNIDQELRLQLLKRATYNGILIWKIDVSSEEEKKQLTVS